MKKKKQSPLFKKKLMTNLRLEKTPAKEEKKEEKEDLEPDQEENSSKLPQTLILMCMLNLVMIKKKISVMDGLKNLPMFSLEQKRRLY